MKLVRIIWGRIILLFGDCPYCYSEPKHSHSCPVCFGENPGDKNAYRDYKWKDRLWRRFRAHVDKDYS